MVASEHEDCVFELEFDREDEAEYFDGEAAAVHVVPEEDVFCGLEGASGIVVDELDEVEELTVDIADDRDRILDSDHVGLEFWVERGVQKTCFARFSSYMYSFFVSFPSRL